MNLIETIGGALIVFVSGMLLARDYTIELIDGIGAVAVPAQAAIAERIVSFGGVEMLRTDFVIMLLLSAVSSAVAAGMRWKNWRAATVNFFLGFMFGVLGAQIVIAVFRLEPHAIFGLAPACSLGAAKVARLMIQDDAAVKAIIGAVLRRK